LKYRMTITQDEKQLGEPVAFTIQVFTDHKLLVPLPITGSYLPVSGLAGSLVYNYRCPRWSATGIVSLLMWILAIDDTASLLDIRDLAMQHLGPLDLLMLHVTLHNLFTKSTDDIKELAARNIDPQDVLRLYSDSGGAELNEMGLSHLE